MIISLYQMDVEYLNPEKNFEKIDIILKQHPESDLLVLPEQFTTSFVVEPEKVQLQPEAEVIMNLRNISKKHSCALVGSVAICDNEGYYRNRMYFVKPNGEVQYYDKRHLYGGGTEKEKYKAGEKRVIVEYFGLRFLLQTCYDLRFPVFSRNRGDYDIAIYVASMARLKSIGTSGWRDFLVCRAMENSIYVIGCNRVGIDKTKKNGLFYGLSAVYNPLGQIQCDSIENEEDFVSFEPSLTTLSYCSNTLSHFEDNDLFELTIEK